MDPGQGDLIQNHEQGLVGYRFFCKQQHSRTSRFSGSDMSRRGSSVKATRISFT